MTSPSPDVVNKIELAFKAMFWLAPIIFAGGVWYSMGGHTRAEVVTVQAEVEQIERKIIAHEQLESHPVTRARLDQVQRVVDRIEVEQQSMNVEQRRAAENLSAICQATNANCR